MQHRQGRQRCDERVCGRVMGEREAEWFVHCEERRNWRCEGEEQPDLSSSCCHLRPMSLLRAIAGFVALQQQWSGLMSMAHVTTKGHLDI